MRDYCRFYFTHLHGLNTTTSSVLDIDFVGQNQAQAHDQATFGAFVANTQGYDQTSIQDLGPFNFLINKSILYSYFSEDITHTGNILNSLGTWMKANLISICDGYEIDPQISPKLQKIYPFNGRARRHFD